MIMGHLPDHFLVSLVPKIANIADMLLFLELPGQTGKRRGNAFSAQSHLLIGAAEQRA